ncbi:2404_t:CDS:2 [Cetraspora pellucida]|uniref:2404_t:CDS:1 n=1 Tax=Cetraspora pellucida TaxID=1433469 RepID=A0ACA9P950_9GLOM|nr:2404_t:CDS:2 [Cetraspora pellucida]
MPNIIRIPCTAHTLQCAIGKGLVDAELLIACAKRLMLFFTTLKQTEKLINAQKNLQRFENIDLSNNDHQLRIIADVSMRWNSSYLSWRRLLQIRSIISMMITNLTLDSDLQIQKDVATELLEGSKYATISFMYSAITVIEQGLISTSGALNTDLSSSNDVFEDDVIYENDENEGVQANYASNEKRHRVNINNPQDCKNLEKK